MSDARLRDLARQAVDDPEARAEWVRIKLRGDDLTPRQRELAALLGEPTAVVGPPPPKAVPGTLVGWLAAAIRPTRAGPPPHQGPLLHDPRYCRRLAPFGLRLVSRVAYAIAASSLEQLTDRLAEIAALQTLPPAELDAKLEDRSASELERIVVLQELSEQDLKARADLLQATLSTLLARTRDHLGWLRAAQRDLDSLSAGRHATPLLKGCTDALQLAATTVKCNDYSHGAVWPAWYAQRTLDAVRETLDPEAFETRLRLDVLPWALGLVDPLSGGPGATDEDLAPLPTNPG